MPLGGTIYFKHLVTRDHSFKTIESMHQLFPPVPFLFRWKKCSHGGSTSTSSVLIVTRKESDSKSFWNRLLGACALGINGRTRRLWRRIFHLANPCQCFRFAVCSILQQAIFRLT